MTLTEARKIFDLANKTAERGAQDLEEWASSSMSRAEALFEGGFISARDRAEAERMAALSKPAPRPAGCSPAHRPS